MKTARPPSWQILLAFAIIYFVWGSTFLAIRVGVREVPPFLLAAMRFFAAGLILYVWMRLKGSPSPTLREWAGASFLGTLIFVVDYGCLFWAEQRVPSGIAASYWRPFLCSSLSRRSHFCELSASPCALPPRCWLAFAVLPC